MPDHVVGRFELEGYRFLAERRHRSLGGHVQQLRVRGGGGRDHDRVDAPRNKSLRAFRKLCADVAGDLRSAIGISVEDRQRGHERALPQASRMQRANPSGADESDVHGPPPAVAS